MKINGKISSFHRVALSSTVSRSNWNLGMLVLVNGGKLEYPEKIIGEGTRTNNKINPQYSATPRIEPEPHWLEPCSPFILKSVHLG